MENENLEENLQEEKTSEETTVSTENISLDPPKKKKKSKLPLIIILILLIAGGAVAAVFLFVANDKNTGFNRAPVAPPTKPATTPEPSQEPTLDPNEDVSIKINEKDKQTCAIIKDKVYKALYQYKTYEETSALMNDGSVIIEIKEGGISNAGKEFNALMSKGLATLQAPITEEKDCYYVLIKEPKEGSADKTASIYVMPGISGIKPTEDEFLAAEKELSDNNTLSETDDKTTADPNAEDSDVVDISKDLEKFNEKQAISTDATACTSIESCVNAALADEQIYAETAKLGGSKGFLLLAACSTPKLAIAGCGPLMKKELLDTMSELTGPKQTGKDVYYIYIEVKTEKTSQRTISTVGKVKVIPGSKKVKPTAKDFKF